MLIERGDAAEPADEPDFIEEDGELVEQAPARRGRLARRIALGAGTLVLLLIAVLAVTAPLSKSLQPITAPSVTLLSAEGKPIARRGSVIDAPVKVPDLPRHIPQAFLAIEDRRFYEHLGIDPWSIARAGVRNLRAGGVVEGGSTISQQMAKLSFLSSDQTAARKIQEAILALWLDAWLDKDEILSRYLSSVYFGDNVYGIRAAANHYFSRKPEDLTVEQAAMLAGLVKAPSRLAPTKNLKGAREHGEVVVQAMVDAGFLDAAAAKKLPQVTLKHGPAKDVPAGTYFADWVFSELGESEPRYGEQRIQTTLEDRLQRLAAQSIRSVGTAGAQVAMVAMRPDGRVVAMVGGRSYKESPFNRVRQAKRQSGSTFKLFVYLAALRAGYTAGDAIEDRPLRIGNWSPENYEGKYQGVISLHDAFCGVEQRRRRAAFGNGRAGTGDPGGARSRREERARARPDGCARHFDDEPDGPHQRLRFRRQGRLSGEAARASRGRGSFRGNAVRGQHAAPYARAARRRHSPGHRPRRRACRADLRQDRHQPG